MKFLKFFKHKQGEVPKEDNKEKEVLKDFLKREQQDIALEQNASNVLKITNTNERPYPKCNCDGCTKQSNCKYGHIVYDEFEKTKLSLVSKFILLHAMDNIVLTESDDVVATVEERHNQNQLLNMEEKKLISTINYLQKQKDTYLDLGKCGKAYYNSVNMGGELQFLKECLDLKRKISKSRDKM